MIVKKIIGLMLITTLIMGCDMFAGPAAKISDIELRAKWKKCKSNKIPSRTAVLACENYERECKRRREDGNKVC